ncbi:MAG: AAA family ATPase, partial [Paludibacteraceae bacterium]|nr:AAA family ATPase [Paludibacteraceae bacterium]
MIERTEYEQLLQSRLNEPRHFMQVIIGPRQVGKTTLVRMTLEKINIPYSIHTADTVKDEGWLSMIWQQERLEMQYNNQPERLLII